MGLACHVGVGLWQVGGTLGLVWASQRGGGMTWLRWQWSWGHGVGGKGGACTPCWGGSTVGLVHGGPAW